MIINRCYIINVKGRVCFVWFVIYMNFWVILMGRYFIRKLWGKYIKLRGDVLLLVILLSFF